MGAKICGPTWQAISVLDKYAHWSIILSADLQQKLEEIKNKFHFKKQQLASRLEFPMIFGDWESKDCQPQPLQHSAMTGTCLILYFDQPLPENQKMKIWMYFGKIQDNRIGQEGVIIYRDLTAYSGQLKNKSDTISLRSKLTREGEGKYFCVNGNVLTEGTWEEDKLASGIIIKNQQYTVYLKDTKFIVEYKDGSRYTGLGEIDTEKIKFVRKGNGQYISADKTYTYKGTWRNDKKEGKGREQIKKNENSTDFVEIFTGSFQEDQRYGPGELINENHEVIKGKWKSNKSYKGIIYKKQYSQEIHNDWS